MARGRGLTLAIVAMMALSLLALPLQAGAQKGKVRYAYYKPGWGVDGVIHLEDLLGKLGWEATYIAYAGSPAALITSFGAGEIDALEMTLWLAANMYERGIPLKVVQATESMQAGIIVPSASPIKSPEQLLGKKLAAIVASTAYHETKYLIKLAYNIDLEKQARVITATTPPDAINLLERGDVDAALLWTTPNDQLLVTGRYRYLVKALDLWRKATGRQNLFPVYVVTIANPKFLEKYPAFASDMRRAQQQAADIFYKDKQKAIQLISQTLGVDRRVVEFAYENTSGILHGLSEEHIEVMLGQLRMAKESGYLKSDLWLDPSRVKRDFFWK